jgi:hypothetical protein
MSTTTVASTAPISGRLWAAGILHPAQSFRPRHSLCGLRRNGRAVARFARTVGAAISTWIRGSSPALHTAGKLLQGELLMRRRFDGAVTPPRSAGFRSRRNRCCMRRPLVCSISRRPPIGCMAAKTKTATSGIPQPSISFFRSQAEIRNVENGHSAQVNLLFHALITDILSRYASKHSDLRPKNACSLFSFLFDCDSQVFPNPLFCEILSIYTQGLMEISSLVGSTRGVPGSSHMIRPAGNRLWNGSRTESGIAL